MNGEYWIMAGLTAALMGILTAVSLFLRPRSGISRALARGVGALCLLWASGQMGGAGLTMANFLLTAALGLPGYGAALAFSCL